jgi:hypothetical protein
MRRKQANNTHASQASKQLASLPDTPRTAFSNSFFMLNASHKPALLSNQQHV